jgi:hypothetical protein
MPRDNTLYNGFVLHDYLLTFVIEDAANRDRLVELFRGPWQGDEVTPTTWEVSNDLSPDQMEQAIVALMGDSDRVVYYYLADAKRMFRVILG